MNPVYTHGIMNEVKADIEGICIELKDQQAQITELKTEISNISQSLDIVKAALQELTIAVITGMPPRK